MRTTNARKATVQLAAAAALTFSLGACGAADDAPTAEPAAAPLQAANSESPEQPTAAQTGEPAETEPPAETTTAAASEAVAETAAAAETDAAGTTPASTSEEPAERAAPTADETLAAADVSAEASDSGHTETLDEDGGIVVDGSRVTFVYVNGTQFTTDIGAPIGEVPFNYTDGTITLALEADGSGMLVDGTAVTSINPDGSGAITETSGILAIEADGSTSCVTGDHYSWTKADGTGAAGDSGGLLIVDGSGTVIVGTPPSPQDLVGRYTACNLEGTARVDLSADVLFTFGSAELTDTGRAVITEVAQTMATNGVTTATVTGHTDWVGSTEFNQDLGQQRADAVADVLSGVVPGVEMSTDSAGESRPVAANANPDGSDNPAGRAQNRRVEIAFSSN